jgi:hypothetical protein
MQIQMQVQVKLQHTNGQAPCPVHRDKPQFESLGVTPKSLTLHDHRLRRCMAQQRDRRGDVHGATIT